MDSSNPKKANKDSNMDEISEFDESELEDLYSWIDGIPLSRPKRNIGRDFSDGVLVAECVKHFLPKWVEIHNYPPANSTEQKMQNWYLLNRKVFTKLNFQLSDDVIRSVCKCSPGVIEKILMHLRIKISRKMWDTQKNPPPGKAGRTSQMVSDKPEADQNINMHAAGPISPGRSHKLPEVPTHAGPYKGTKSKAFPDADMVPKVLLEDKEQELLAKEETIQILNAKIRRLEHLLHLKDIRIDDLQKRVEFQRPTGKKI
ncbi:sperm flagellar protein 1-like [Gigantopelta aegis]|uniref:sperm flagellar protein 1-like n=1 Tax=Gigantopelta aegis TaxID=1735272 RepID=UPI001B88A045|nr:sperm flagellar protein 1-like [Gigantopelta aegis]